MTEPKIEHRPAFLVVGTLYVGKNENGEIPAMWQNDFLPRIDEIAVDESDKGICYGACRCTGDPDVGIEYLAALPVTSLDSIPQGMVGWEIPENTYAVFSVAGLSNLGAGLDSYYKEWQPNSTEYEAADGPMFELYPPTFDSEQATLYLYFPVRKKS